MKNSKYQADSDEPDYFQPFDKMKLISAADLAKLKAKKRKKHWGEPIQSNQIGMLFGPRGHGKTWVALGIAVSMSACVNFLDKKPVRARKVIYMDGEMDLVTLKNRTIALCKSLNTNPPDGLKIFTPEIFTGLLPSINTMDGQREIDALIGADWDVLFIDNYSAWSGDGRETAEAWAPMMRWMLGHKRAGRTIIVIHHTGKTGKQRGSSSHEDALDWSVALKPADGAFSDGALRFNLVWEKNRHLSSTDAKPIAVTMGKDEEGGLTWSQSDGVHKNSRAQDAKELMESGLSQAEVAKKLSVNRTTVGRWLKSTS
ncbi:AAA family ATPase [Comamonas sp. F1-6]|uniref:AAA family ATPase n=1 Tax=Comamonas sp. F1-6 TaxID=673550 RepID=UPI0031DE8689